MIRWTYVLLISVFFSCSKNNVTFFENIPLDGWEQSKWVEFKLKNTAPSKTSRLEWIIRHSNDYPFSNIFVITKIFPPKGEPITDTLEYYLAEPSGKWIGKGFFLKEINLAHPYKVFLASPGVYTFNIKPSVAGFETNYDNSFLPGIHNVGIKLTHEKDE